MIVLAGTLVVATSAPAGRAAAHHSRLPTAVLGKRIIGHSVRHRPLIAYHLGDPNARRTALILGEMHGDEPAGVVVARSLIDGHRSIEGINLWVIPTMNPDGYAAGTRQNAHGVDLNRNWRHNWAHLTGEYYSGPRPMSEPETRAVARFIRAERPRFVVSLHQPLHGVDQTAGHGREYRAFRGALSRNLNLPIKNFDCWSVCHGSLSGWYADHHFGVAVETIEFGWTPARGYLVGRARRGIIAALGGRLGSLAAHDPNVQLTIAGGVHRAHIVGFARDRDEPTARLTYRVLADGRRVAHGVANGPRRFHHGIDRTLRAVPGRHRYCVVVDNVGAGTRNPRVCAQVRVRTRP